MNTDPHRPSGAPSEPSHPRPPTVVPEGYRQGIITAITVLIGFSLAFVRYWTFEAPGEWKLQSLWSTGAAVLAILGQVYALYRSLRLEDREIAEYRKTVRWFIGSVLLLLLGLLLATWEMAPR